MLSSGEKERHQVCPDQGLLTQARCKWTNQKWAPYVIDQKYIFGFLQLVLHRKWGQKLGDMSVINQALIVLS